MMRAARTIPALAGALFAALAASSAEAQPLSTYWPHEDGRQWIYDQHYEEFYPPGGDVVDNQVRLYFDGTTTAAGGIAAQFLKGSVAWLPARTRTRMQVPSEIADPLLQHVWIARPDLRAGILRAAGEEPCESKGIPGWYPLLLAGGLAYVQTANEIAAWRCDVSNTRAWLWLTSDLTPGSTTTIQLVPDLASDVYLHVTVAGLQDVTVPAGTFGDCLHVDYVVDYGTSLCTDEFGNHLGTQRHETTGFVRYAPGVGPIECLEEFMVVEETGDCGGPEVGEPVARSTLKLYAPSTPAQTASWGQLKATYRD